MNCVPGDVPKRDAAGFIAAFCDGHAEFLRKSALGQ
jgi:prepilin-type processing-associated H-X9-DG protein